MLDEGGRGRRDRGRPLGDLCLRAHTTTGAHGFAEETLENLSGTPRLVCRAQLPEDLALPHDAGVETGRDTKEVTRRVAAPVPVDHRRELVAAVAGRRSQHFHRTFLRVLVADEVHLGAVARREDDRLLPEPLGERAATVSVERHALAQVERRRVMRNADDRQHRRRRLGANRAGPRYWACLAAPDALLSSKTSPRPLGRI